MKFVQFIQQKFNTDHFQQYLSLSPEDTICKFPTIHLFSFFPWFLFSGEAPHNPSASYSYLLSVWLGFFMWRKGSYIQFPSSWTNLDPLTLSTELAAKLWALKTIGQNGCANLRCTPQARRAETSAKTEILTWTDTCSISFEVKK